MNQVLNFLSFGKKKTRCSRFHFYFSPELFHYGIFRFKMKISFGKMKPAAGAKTFFTCVQRLAAGSAQFRVHEPQQIIQPRLNPVHGLSEPGHDQESYDRESVLASLLFRYFDKLSKRNL